MEYIGKPVTHELSENVAIYFVLDAVERYLFLVNFTNL
jgi:hypothetical protein